MALHVCGSMNLDEAQGIVANWGGSLANPHRAFVVMGGQVSWGGGRGIVINGGAGIDLVWDLWNEQFSAFAFRSLSVTVGSAIGAGVSAYVGIGFGTYPNVHSAWSGRFYSATLSAAVPGLKWGSFGLSAGVSGFTSPDGKMVGASGIFTLSASIPLDPVAAVQEQTLSVEFGGGDWVPLDALTRALSFGGPLHTLGGHKILGLESGVLGVANHMSRIVPPVSGLYQGLATYATAVSVIKSATTR